MKDALGNEVNVGDEVMFIPNHYKGLYRGVIKKITEQRVKIAVLLSNGQISTFVYTKSSDQFMKIIKPQGVLNVYYIKTVDNFSTKVAANSLTEAIELVKEIRGNLYSAISTSSDGTINYKL